MALSLAKSAASSRLVTQRALSIGWRNECARCFATSVESEKGASHSPYIGIGRREAQVWTPCEPQVGQVPLGLVQISPDR